MSYSRGRPAFLGIDLGTSQLKALLAAPDGRDVRVLGRGRAQYRVDVPAEGMAETDPEDWWRAAGAAVRAALAAAAGEGAAADVRAIAVAGQMHGVVLTDAAGAPVRPAILWPDRRAAAETAYYAELPAELTGPLGNQPSPGMAGPILRWLAAHEPAAMASASWALQPKDWLRLRLTGAAATDPTDASGTLLFDLARGSWAADLVRALGLPADKLPQIRDPGQVAGRLRPDAAAHLRIGPGVPVATGAADTAAALFAAGLPQDAALLTLGTGGQWVVPATLRPAANTNLFRAIGGGGQAGAGLYRLAAVQNMGETINWARTMLGVSWEHAYSTAGLPWRADTPVFLPYLVQERWDPGARGCWAGLTLAHGKDDLLRSALEGVAFLLRDRLADLRAAGHDPVRVVLGGGGTRHPAWRQLLADVLGLPLYPAPTTWLSAAGAALIAAAVAGFRSLVPTAQADLAAPAITPITPAASADADAAYARYQALRPRRPQFGDHPLPTVIGGAATGRSADETAVIAPGERDAASAGYGRFLTLSRTKGL